MSDVPGFGKALVIITGASRGFGRALALEVAARVDATGSVLILAARSDDKLHELQTHVTRVASELTVRCVTADLSRKEDVERVITVIRETQCADIDHLLLFNNAASLGDVSRYCRDFTDVDEVDSYLSFNVSSALCLTTGVLRAVPRRVGLTRVIINISSLCAIKPFASWVLYCTGKAAREMMFRVLAEEEPDLRVLSYAPGPLDTDMQLQARSSSADGCVRSACSGLHAQGQLLTCEASVSKLMKVLLEGNFTSGAHLDFYD
ncbi:sepiapterin reductase a [Triplophysa rosa]|uniref:Sepiapterin reductase n=1 Tax=Triplophysa rosa TaxID=992332 RepID=A0A9W7X2S5_TRIRA|nr:sepiapterin reductase a [Triplophysa rosa]KAI7812963.1 sepiapterin reductase [Triplophysa rosa]